MDKTKNCLFLCLFVCLLIYLFIYLFLCLFTIYVFICLFIWYVRNPYMLSALFVRDALFHSLHLYISKNIAKLATFESQKVVCTTHLWNPKKEIKAKA